MKALITGGAGFIGSSIARKTMEMGWETRIFDNFLTGFRENVPDGAELVEEDIRDLDALRRATDGVDVVFHQAAFRSVPKSVDDPTLSNSCNVTGTLNVLIAAQEADVKKVVYASSSSAYGDVDVPVNREDMPTAPASPYAVSKLAGEHYCRCWTAVHGLPTVSLRYFNVFGPGQHPDSKYSAVFPAFISALVKGEPPEVHWDGEQSRDFSYIDDVVHANLLAAQSDDRTNGRAFNIAGGRPKTVNEVLNAVSQALDIWIEPTRTPKRKGDIRRTAADVTLAGELLGWKSESNWDEAVATTVRWFVDRGKR
jgi:nucleoside-diphosphate-sugar epimerase